MTSQIKPLKTSTGIINELKTFQQKPNLLIFLDYDGTLVPIQARPEEAILSDSAYQTLKELLANKKFQIVVVSGRNQAFLAEQLKQLPIDYAAEHGAFFIKADNSVAQRLGALSDPTWKNLAKKILGEFVKQFPQSHIEEKEICVTWHYRQASLANESLENQTLLASVIEKLNSELLSQPISILEGSKCIEVRPNNINKGAFINFYLKKFTINSEDTTIVAIGDDTTDEDMFKAVNQFNGITIKVGSGNTAAQYRIDGTAQVLPLIKELHSTIPTNHPPTEINTPQ